MEDHTAVWRWWQAGLERFRRCFAEPGFRRFAEWLTGLVVDMEEHTVTQALTGLGLEPDWMALERLVEYGPWERQRVERATWQTIAEAYPARWHDYRVTAVDDTKVHRTSAKVWGACTFHEPTARCPNRAETVRAHNWVVIGALIPGTPWQCLPVAGRDSTSGPRRCRLANGSSSGRPTPWRSWGMRPGRCIRTFWGSWTGAAASRG